MPMKLLLINKSSSYFSVIVFAVLVSLLFVNIYVREKKEKQGCQEKMEMLALRYY